MPFFGNNVVGGDFQVLRHYLWGHFDIPFMASWGLPVPACIVTEIFIYARGSYEPELSVVQFGIYDANVGPYNTWPLFATTPTLSIAAGAPAQWWSLPVNIPLPGGFYALSILDVNGETMANSIPLYFTVKPLGPYEVAGVNGVFPNPLGGCAWNDRNMCIYADYVLPAGGPEYKPTAACQC